MAKANTAAAAAKKTEAAPDAQNGRDRFLKFTISGEYYNSKKEKIDFDRVVGVIPYCDEENGVGSMHVRGRYAARWIKEALKPDGSKLYPDRIEKIRQCHIDDVEEVTGTLSFVGKDIKELTIEEMQDLATSKDLRFIPVPNTGYSKRDMLIRAYVAYADKVLRKKVKWQDADFVFAKLPPIILNATPRKEVSKKITNEEIIEREQNAKMTKYGEKDDPKNRFTLAELMILADNKQIEYDAQEVTFDELYAKLFTAG